MAIKWIKSGKKVTPDGTTNIYCGDDTPYTIESRKRKIPHANREGFWWHTSYFVLKDGAEVIERYSLRDAKEYAENLIITDKGENT